VNQAESERGIRRVRTLRERVRTRHKSRNGVKDLGGGRPRYLEKQDPKKLRQEYTGNINETVRKTTGLEIAKRIAQSTVGLRTIKYRVLWRGRSLPKRKKEAAHGVRTEDVGAPATPSVGREKPLDDWDTPGSTGALTVSRAGRAHLGGSGGSSWRVVTARKTEPQEDATSRNPRKRTGGRPVGYSRRIALKREQCYMYTHC
jgi:hypothetical protein